MKGPSMARTPPVPAENQSPFPIEEAPHPEPTGEPTAAETANAALEKGIASARDGIATAREQAGPMVEKAKQFAKDRPWTAAALIGSLAVAVLGSLRRGKL